MGLTMQLNTSVRRSQYYEAHSFRSLAAVRVSDAVSEYLDFTGLDAVISAENERILSVVAY